MKVAQFILFILACRLYSGDPTSVPVQIQAFDALSGVSQYRLIIEDFIPAEGGWDLVYSDESTVYLPSVEAVSAVDGAKSFELQLRDRAGNQRLTDQFGKLTFLACTEQPMVGDLSTGEPLHRSNA